MYKILANTIFLGKDVLFLSECHSTNDKAYEIIRTGKAVEGTIIITDHQTRGKGQRGNTWETEKGKNLTFSLILRPTFLDISEQFLLNMAFSHSLASLLQDYVPELKVKWPNDLVIPQQGKLAGILIENILGKEGWEYAVLGVGINVNQQNFSVPKATSLSLLTGSEFKLEELFRMLIVNLERGYLSLKKGKFAEIKKNYLNQLFLKDQWAEFTQNDRRFLGKIVGISSSGKIQIELKNNEIQEFAFKEVSFPNI